MSKIANRPFQYAGLYTGVLHGVVWIVNCIFVKKVLIDANQVYTSAVECAVSQLEYTQLSGTDGCWELSG